jgi:hypothetical protein
MGHGCGGGGLGGERRGDCGSDLRLKGGGGFRHPKIKRKCGLELEQAAAVAENRRRNNNELSNLSAK